MQTTHIAYAHLLKPLSELAYLCRWYNALTNPADYKADDDHSRDAARAREIMTELRPYLLLGVVREWESGRLALSPRATSDAA